MNIANPKRFYTLVAILVFIVLVIVGFVLLKGKSSTGVTNQPAGPVTMPKEINQAMEQTAAESEFSSKQTVNLTNTDSEYRIWQGKLAFYAQGQIQYWRNADSFYVRDKNCLRKSDAPPASWPSAKSAVFALPSVSGAFQKSTKNGKTIFTSNAKVDSNQPAYTTTIVLNKGKIESYSLVGNKLEQRTVYKYQNVSIEDISKIKC